MAKPPSEQLTSDHGRGLALETAPTMVAWYSLGVLTLTHVLSFVDRKLPFILADSIKQDLQLSDTQLGLVTGAMFAIVYSTMAVPLGALADRGSRKRIIAAAVVVWSSLTAAGGLAQNFWQLGAARMGVAVGEAVLTPAANSIIGDLFAHRYRARAIAIYFMGAQVGIISGLTFGGWINEMADWRMAMFLLGAPGILVTLLIALTLREPQRVDHAARSRKEATPGIASVVLQIMRQPTLVHLLVASALASITNSGLQAFLPSHVIRTFHMGTTQIGLTYGMTLGMAGLIGVLLGGVGGDWLRRKGQWKAVAFVGAGEALAMPLIVLALLMDSYPAFLVLLFVSMLLGALNNGPTYATFHSLMKPNTHATAIAFYLLFVGGLGLAMGPIITGMLSDHMASMGSQASLQSALLILMIPKLWAATHYILSALNLRKRERPGGDLARSSA